MLRASLPSAHLTYLVGPWADEAARAGPEVDEIRNANFPGFTRRANPNLVAPYVTLARTAANLRAERFDLAVVLRPDHWWGALLALSAGIPLRVGTATPETAPLLTHACTSHGEHAADHALAVARLALRAAGAEPVEVPDVAEFGVDAAAHVAAEELWRAYGLVGRRVVGLHPSAGAPLKSWPSERWAHLADALAETVHDGSVVLIGAPADQALLTSIRARMKTCTPVLCGQSLQVSAAIYARCAALVSVDSGAGHLAAAVGTPTVRLYGPAPPAIFGPWPPRADQQVLMTRALACTPCGGLEAPPCGATLTPACMLALGVEDVLKAVRVQLCRG